MLAGTNGGVSIAGTIASAVGGLVVGLAYYIALCLLVEAGPTHKTIPQWPLLLVGTIAGVLGSMIDSFLGAVFQYSGKQWSGSVSTNGD